jgi:hypothetical protein
MYFNFTITEPNRGYDSPTALISLSVSQPGFLVALPDLLHIPIETILLVSLCPDLPGVLGIPHQQETQNDLSVTIADCTTEACGIRDIFIPAGY